MDHTFFDGLVSEREFARLVGTSLASVRRWRTLGGLPWVAFGRKLMIPVQQALAWAENRARKREKARRLSRPRGRK